MYQNIIILTVLVLVVLLTSKNINLPTLVNKNIKDVSTCQVPEDPCFLYENTNRTQTIYLKLVNAVQKLSNKEKKLLSGNCKEDIFIQGTTDNRLKTELDEVTKIILDALNKRTGFYFQKSYFDTITIFTDPHGNKNFKYNVFAYDPNEELNVRFYIDVIKYIVPTHPRKQKVTCTSVTTPGMDTFEAGYPQPEQLLPLPTQVISTGGGPDVLSDAGINIKEIPCIRSLHLNEFKVYNTNAVINANGKCLMDPVCGDIKENTTLSSSLYNGLNTPFQEPSCQRNKWILPPDQPKNLKQWPCATQSPYWGTDGIPNPSTCNTQETGIRSSTTEYPVSPEFWRSNYGIKQGSPYSALFSLTVGSPAIDGADFTSSV